MRRAARRDANEPEIVEALERCGATVARLNDPNLPDLVVGWRGENLFAEVKEPKARLRENQRAFAGRWRGGPVFVLRTVEHALILIGQASGKLEMAA